MNKIKDQEAILKRIDLELAVIFDTNNEVATNSCWERARALTWVLGEEMRNDQWLRDRYEEVKYKIKQRREAAEEMIETIDREAANG